MNFDQFEFAAIARMGTTVLAEEPPLVWGICSTDSIVEAGATVIVGIVATAIVWWQVRRSRDAAKLQTAVDILSIRAQIQMSYAQNFDERWHAWALAKKACAAGSAGYAMDLHYTSQRLTSLLWGQVCYYLDGLFDQRRLHMYTRYRVWEFAELAGESRLAKEPRQALLDSSRNLGDKNFASYIQVLSVAGAELAERNRLKGLAPEIHDDEAEKAVKKIMHGLAEQRRLRIEEGDKHDLASVAESLLNLMTFVEPSRGAEQPLSHSATAVEAAASAARK